MMIFMFFFLYIFIYCILIRRDIVKIGKKSSYSGKVGK